MNNTTSVGHKSFHMEVSEHIFTNIKIHYTCGVPFVLLYIIMYYMYYIYYYTCKKLGTLMDMVYASIYDPEIDDVII